jgi:hypothetical protein
MRHASAVAEMSRKVSHSGKRPYIFPAFPAARRENPSSQSGGAVTTASPISTSVHAIPRPRCTAKSVCWSQLSSKPVAKATAPSTILSRLPRLMAIAIGASINPSPEPEASRECSCQSRPALGPTPSRKCPAYPSQILVRSRESCAATCFAVSAPPLLRLQNHCA